MSYVTEALPMLEILILQGHIKQRMFAASSNLTAKLET
jgi:hypothetical protein